jgi:hypothetical protein
MSFGGRGFQRHALLLSAAARIRFCGATILAAAALVFGAAATQGQSLADDQPANAFTNTTELISTGDSGYSLLPDAPAALASAPVGAQSAPYAPITGQERLNWIVKNTLWPQHLAGGVITSAVGTALNHPREDGPHWGGFGERFGVRLTGVATSNVMEAGFGALWGEDPRYFPAPEDSFGGRVKNVIKMTFLARRPDGNFAPAYARFIAVPGNNFLSNAWRPDSEADVQHALLRTAEGFAGRMGANAWDEFWPQAKSYILHRGKQQP